MRTSIGAMAAFLVSCVGGQSGTITNGSAQACRAVSSTMLEMSSSTDVGVTPEALMVRLSSGPLHAPLLWYQQAGEVRMVETELTLTVNPQGTEPHWVVESSESGDTCDEYLDIVAELRFETADGAFNEIVGGHVQRLSSNAVTRFVGVLPSAALAGGYDVGVLSANGYPADRFDFALQLEPELGCKVWSRATTSDGDQEALIAETIESDAR